MSTAEAYDDLVVRGPLTPPRPAPPPSTLSGLRRLRAIRENGLASWDARAYEDDILCGRFLGRKSFTLNSPDAIRHVLIENYENYTRTPPGLRVLRPILGREGLLLAEGRDWKHQRRTLAPAFTPRAVETLVPHMMSAIGETLNELETSADRPVDLREAMQRMTLAIAGRTMFSFSMAGDGATLRGFVMEYAHRLAKPHLLDFLLPLSWPSPQDIARARFRKRWTAFVRKLIAERRTMMRPGEGARDMFELMVAARDPETGATFSDTQLADQVATMILAGHETTATALFWALYLLSLDPGTQEMVAAEARAAGDLDASKLEALRFTRAVLDETMRLYPPAFLIARAAAGPDRIAGEDVTAGDVILISPWLLHRHTRLWHDPHAFMPGRFMPGAPQPNRFAYLPFGVGPRVCIGAHFALVEATLALARFIERFHVSLVDRDPVMPVGVVTTQPDRSPGFQLTRR